MLSDFSIFKSLGRRGSGDVHKDLGGWANLKPDWEKEKISRVST